MIFNTWLYEIVQYKVAQNNFRLPKKLLVLKSVLSHDKKNPHFDP